MEGKKESFVEQKDEFSGFYKTKLISLFFHNKFENSSEQMQVDKRSKFSEITKQLGQKIGMTFFYLEHDGKSLLGDATPEDKNMENGALIHIIPVD